MTTYKVDEVSIHRVYVFRVFGRMIVIKSPYNKIGRFRIKRYNDNVGDWNKCGQTIIGGEEMKTKFILILLVLFGSCNEYGGLGDSLNDLKAPVVLVAKSPEGIITLCDANGTYVTIGLEWHIAHTISASYEKGDTLIYVKEQEEKK